MFQVGRGGQFIDGGNRSTRRKPPTCRKCLSSTPPSERDSNSTLIVQVVVNPTIIRPRRPQYNMLYNLTGE